MNLTSIYYFSRLATIKIVTVFIFLISCSSDEQPKIPLQVSGISPTSGPTNTTVIITGTNFSTVSLSNGVQSSYDKKGAFYVRSVRYF